jgi:hypothetical protein
MIHDSALIAKYVLLIIILNKKIGGTYCSRESVIKIKIKYRDNLIGSESYDIMVITFDLLFYYLLLLMHVVL